MIDLRHLKTIKAIAETDSLIEASERLHVTQSALSHQLKELESRLDITLFIRKSRPLKLTTAGQRLLRLADDVLPVVKQAERDIKRLAGGEAGRLHIAIECHSCFQWLMPTLDSFRDLRPEVEMDIVTGFNFAPLPALARGDLDLVVTSDPLDIEGLAYQPLFRYESLLALGHHHPLTQRNFINPEDLEQETIIAYPVDRQRLDIFHHFLDPAGVEPAGIRNSELTVMMMQLVASGRGVCALPNWALYEYLEKDYVQAKSLGKNGVWAILYAAVREEQLQMGYIREFLELAKETCFNHLKGIKPVSSSKKTKP